MGNRNKTKCGAMPTEGKMKMGHHSSRNCLLQKRVTDEHDTLAVCYEHASVLSYDSIRYKRTPMWLQKRTDICMFGLHYRKISDRLSSLISPCQSVLLRDGNNGRLGENVFGHPTYWGRTISDNTNFFRSMAEGPTLATTLHSH